MPVHVCVPVLRRYDLLRRLVKSLDASTVKPDALFVIDNGRNPSMLASATSACSMPVVVERLAVPLGVAASWNWFIQHVPEERVIVNDDVAFGPDSLARLTASKADLVWAAGFGFSCFVLRDTCVKKVGLFDETLSPGYAYYEDDDYLQRIDGRGTRESLIDMENVECGITHVHSATLKIATHEELLEHHRRFKIAQRNYMTKWGLAFL